MSRSLVLIWQGGNYYWIALSSHRGLRLLPTNDRNVTSTNMFQERIDSQHTLWQTGPNHEPEFRGTRLPNLTQLQLT